MSNHEDEDEKDLSGYDMPAMTSEEFFLSPEQTQNPPEIYGQTPPPRVMSSHSLAGEDFILSARAPPLDFPTDIALSPFTTSEGTQTPPSLPDPVTPPRINLLTSTAGYESLSPPNRIIRPQPQPQPQSQSQHASAAPTSNSLPGRMRPPRVPQVALQPAPRGNHGRHGRGLSNSEFSFLSALTDGTHDNHSLNTSQNNSIATLSASSQVSVPRRRTVSWDYNEAANRGRSTTDSPGELTNISTQSTPASLLQPILNEEFHAPPASIVTDSRPEVATSQHSQIQGSQIQGSQIQGLDEIVSSSSALGSSDRKSKADAFQRGIKEGDKPAATVKTKNGNSPEKSVSRRGGPVWNPSAGQDTGSFIVTDQAVDNSPSKSDSQKPTSPEDHPLKRGHPLKRYTVDEVTDAYPQEPPEETLLMSRIEVQERQSNYEKPMSEIPVIPVVMSDLAGDQISGVHEEKKDPESVISPHSKKPSNETFGDIAKKLLDGSPMRGDKSQETRNTGLRQQGPMHHRQPSTITADAPIHAGDKLYAAAETLFGQYTGSISNWGPDEEKADEETTQPSGDAPADPNSSASPSRRRRLFAFRTKARKDLRYFAEFLGPHRPSLQNEFYSLFRWIMIPSLLSAILLYYGVENPPTGYNLDADSYVGEDGPLGSDDPASLSWWLLFCGVRQVITLELARLTQLITIDFFTLRTRTFPRILGPNMALLVAQSKGWPFILLFWGIWNYALLYGDRRFAYHWAYWQSWIGMMNETNPHGGITFSDTYGGVLFSATLVGIAAAIKRAVLGQIVGKRVVRNYREEMGRLMKKLILLNDVSSLSMQFHVNAQDAVFPHFDHLGESRSKHAGLGVDVSMLASSNMNSNRADSFDYSDMLSTQSRGKHMFTASVQLEIMELLEEWEEPELQGVDEELITVGTILQFRRALEFIRDEYPFSPAFGGVRTREDCVASAQTVFERLMHGNTGPYLDFDSLCLLAKDSTGKVDHGTVRELIRVFRPNRDGQLSKLDFVKSVDSIYKSLRLLVASINNSQQIDRAYERIINVIFFVCMGFIVMAIIGVDIQALVIGLGSIIVSFAFMIGSASSKYLEGILFVLVRKPYDIGDRVSIDAPTTQPNSFGGDSSWIVENVDLYTTTARLGTTRELATFANGSLAGMRIMNMNRSDKPNVYLNLKFSVDSTLQQRQMFKQRMTAFVKERPREWIRLVDFRSTRIEADLGYVEYVLIIQHRERWQNLGAILSSRGQIFNHAVELQKDLDMKYKAPHVPVDIRRMKSESSRGLFNVTSNGSDSSGDGLSVVDEPKKER